MFIALAKLTLRSVGARCEASCNYKHPAPKGADNAHDVEYLLRRSQMFIAATSPRHRAPTERNVKQAVTINILLRRSRHAHDVEYLIVGAHALAAHVRKTEIEFASSRTRSV
jgi:hypothetical protein